MKSLKYISFNFPLFTSIKPICIIYTQLKVCLLKWDCAELKIVYLDHFFFAFASFLAGAGAAGDAEAFPFSFPFSAFFFSTGAFSGAGAAAAVFLGIVRWSGGRNVFLFREDTSNWSEGCLLSNVRSLLDVGSRSKVTRDRWKFPDEQWIWFVKMQYLVRKCKEPLKFKTVDNNPPFRNKISSLYFRYINASVRLLFKNLNWFSQWIVSMTWSNNQSRGKESNSNGGPCTYIK